MKGDVAQGMLHRGICTGDGAQKGSCILGNGAQGRGILLLQCGYILLVLIIFALKVYETGNIKVV